MKKGGLERGWKVENIDCAVCSSRATAFVSAKDLSFTVREHCADAARVTHPVKLQVLEKHVEP